MVKAYVLVQTNVGKAVEVADALRRIDGVALCDDVTGPYDVIVVVETATMDALGQLVATELQQVPGITRTVTCPVVHLN